MARHYGEVKHSGRKRHQWLSRTVRPRSRAMAIQLSSNVERLEHGYAAVTCMVGKSRRATRAAKRCASGFGRSPTKALKKSLSALAKKL